MPPQLKDWVFQLYYIQKWERQLNGACDYMKNREGFGWGGCMALAFLPDMK